MIADLLAAWPLFAQSWITAWLLATLLAIIGIALVARGAIFRAWLRPRRPPPRSPPCW